MAKRPWPQSGYDRPIGSHVMEPGTGTGPRTGAAYLGWPHRGAGKNQAGSSSSTKKSKIWPHWSPARLPGAPLVPRREIGNYN